VRQSYTAVIKRSGSWWIGWIEEIPGVNCQERTREELLETLRLTLAEALEGRHDSTKVVAAKMGRAKAQAARGCTSRSMREPRSPCATESS
jgi:predicted RNase H-like HicB family nuclease